MKRVWIVLAVVLAMLAVGAACTYWYNKDRDIKVRIRIVGEDGTPCGDDLSYATVYQSTNPNAVDELRALYFSGTADEKTLEQMKATVLAGMQIVGTAEIETLTGFGADGNPLEYVVIVPRSMVVEKTDYWHCFTVADLAGNESVPSAMAPEPAQADWTAPRPGLQPSYE